MPFFEKAAAQKRDFEQMNITRSLIDNAGIRSPIIRAAMVQAGNKTRIDAMKRALLSIGVCELTLNDIQNNGYRTQEKAFSFSAESLTYVLLDEDEFNQFSRINNGVDFEVAHIRNGVIGIRRKKAE